MQFKTKNIFNNRKTKFSVDFGICDFMSKDPNTGNYSSKTCPGCYSATLINIYPGVKAKLEKITGIYPDIDDFKSDMAKIKKTGHRFIRFYSLGDYREPADELYIKAAADIIPVEIFSKTLMQFWRHRIPGIAAHPDVNISLSTNSSWDDKYRADLYDFLLKNKLLRNVQINYTFIGDEPMRHVPHVSVYHTTKKNKLELFKFFGYHRVCCARAEDGTKIVAKNTGNYKGSCAKCPLCQLPAADVNGQIFKPGLVI
jgi:hypothetical protein